MESREEGGVVGSGSAGNSVLAGTFSIVHAIGGLYSR